ncbi:MAG: hypothetical protein ACRC62_36975 [Microcoleus sp.]
MTSNLAKRTQRIRSIGHNQLDRYHELNHQWKADRRDWKPEEILGVVA